MAKVTVPTGTDKGEYCKYVQGVFACYPQSCCEDANMKAAMKASEDAYKTYLDGCSIKCGASSALRAGALTTFFVAAFALLASH